MAYRWSSGPWADQPINAARAAAAGVAIVVDSDAEVSDAVTCTLRDATLHARTARIAAEIGSSPTPAHVIATLAEHASPQQ